MSKATGSSVPLVGASASGSVTHTPTHRERETLNFSRKIQRCMGFNKGYNMCLWILFSAVMIGFAGSRFGFLDLDGTYREQAAPGEHFLVKDRLYRIGLYIHLSCVLPCGLLSVFQFLPAIRHNRLILHRINGYIVLTLLLGGAVGAVIMTRHAFGGEVPTQAAIGTVNLATTLSAILAYYNIKMLQIDQHRKWMLRTMFYMGTIITVRIIMGAGVVVIAKIGTYDNVWSCDQLMDVVNSTEAAKFYPSCLENLNNKVIVPANFDRTETIGSALRISFGMGFWLAFLIHAFGVELYIRLTAGESERLRMVSYEKQREAGITPAGSAGTTNDRLGDAKWTPVATRAED